MRARPLEQLRRAGRSHGHAADGRHRYTLEGVAVVKRLHDDGGDGPLEVGCELLPLAFVLREYHVGEGQGGRYHGGGHGRLRGDCLLRDLAAVLGFATVPSQSQDLFSHCHGDQHAVDAVDDAVRRLDVRHDDARPLDSYDHTIPVRVDLDGSPREARGDVVAAPEVGRRVGTGGQDVVRDERRQNAHVVSLEERVERARGEGVEGLVRRGCLGSVRRVAKSEGEREWEGRFC